jgi:hypothetical protein
MRCMLVAVAAALVLVGCSEFDKPKPVPAMSAERLGAPSPSMLRYLNPDERAALDRVGMGGRVAGDDQAGDVAAGGDGPGDDVDGAGDAADDPDASTSDKAGQLGISLLSVGITLGALAAPFFMF